MTGDDRGWAAPPLTPPRSKKKARRATPAEPPAQAEQPQAEQPQAEQPQAEHPQAEHPQAEHPQAEHPQAEHPQAEQPQAEHPQAEQPQAPEPQAGELRAEEPHAGEPRATQARLVPDDTLIGETVPPLDDTLIAEAVRGEEAPTDELPVIEDVSPAVHHLTTQPPPDTAPRAPGPSAPEPPVAEQSGPAPTVAEQSGPAPTVAEQSGPAPAETAGEPAAGEPAVGEPAPAAPDVSREDPTVQMRVLKVTPRPEAPAREPRAPGAAPPGASPPGGPARQGPAADESAADESAAEEPVPSEPAQEEPEPSQPAAVMPGRPKPPPDPASLVSPERLAEFFAPRSIAVVGASDHSAWARFVLASAAATGFTGELIPVHHIRRTVFGRPAIGSLRDLAEPVDLAFILVPTDAVESVVDDAGAAGVRGAIVLASGYRETGDEGQAMERALARQAAAHGITLLGPNCLGFLNAHASAGPFALTAPQPVQPGPVGIALQSGALASVILSFARARAIGISTLATMGNEAMITATDMIDYLVADDNTKVICLFLEQIGDPARFAAAAERAREAGKPIVALKAGSSTVGRQAALAHTGSVAGDDAVVDAALRQMNVIRVTSIEELLSTAALLGYGRVPAGRRMGVLTASGGACDIIADRAAAQGIEMPPFSAKAAEAIAPHLPPFVQVRNPLDVTGFFLANQRYSALTAIDHALDAAVEDPDLDVVFFTGLTLPDVRPADEAAAGLLEERVAWLGRRIASAPVPVIPVGSTCVDVTSYGRDLLGRNDIHLLGGIDLGVQAIGNALRWAEGRDRPWAGPAVPPADRFARQAGEETAREETAGEEIAPEETAGEAQAGEEVAPEEAAGVAQPGEVPGGAAQPDDGATAPAEAHGERGEVAAEGVWPEADARALLSGFGIPVVPAELTGSPDDAAAAARRLGYPVALRISSAELAHKSEAGGVALGLRTVTQVKAAFKRVSAAGGLAPEAIDGVTVSPMRTGGTELLAGVTVDPSFGPVLAVGLGGVWVEVLGDVSLRVLPVTPAEVGRMLGELRGAPLLRGARGQRPADLDALARVICAIGDAALSLGGSLRALEVNPLWVSGDQIEALDVLVETGPPTGPESPESESPEPESPELLGARPGPHRTDPGE